jgi:hypothetical protein
MNTLRQFWNHPKVQQMVYFFPLQLFLLHIKRNHVLILFWLMLAMFITGQAGKTYGVQFLFLDPEYMGRVDFWSFLILGFAMGGFIMAFHIASYTLNATKFPFLATLSRPFFKYSFNNSLIPTLFVGLYLYCIITFQLDNELVVLEEQTEVRRRLMWEVGGFIGGILLFMIPGYMYFIALSRAASSTPAAAPPSGSSLATTSSGAASATIPRTSTIGRSPPISCLRSASALPARWITMSPRC